MTAKFHVGEVVRTKRGWIFETVGPVYKVIAPSKDMALLWGEHAPHYLIKDNQSGEFISVIERGIERVKS